MRVLICLIMLSLSLFANEAILTAINKTTGDVFACNGEAMTFGNDRTREMTKCALNGCKELSGSRYSCSIIEDGLIYGSHWYDIPSGYVYVVVRTKLSSTVYVAYTGWASTRAKAIARANSGDTELDSDQTVALEHIVK